MVTMLDIGQECEAGKISAVHSLVGQLPEEWGQAELDSLGGEALDLSRPHKLLYGSDFAYALDDAIPIEQVGTHCLHSGAKGGLSNVWGASVLPARSKDFMDWPITGEAMAPHYAAVARLLGLTGRHDELEGLYPFHTEPSAPLMLSHQANLILTRMRTHRESLQRTGIHFGASRLAVRTLDTTGARGCQHVGMCLTGCPYMAIWNAGASLAALMEQKGFTYQGGVRVSAVEPFSGGVQIRGALAQVPSAVLGWEGKAVYLACGPLSSSAIVLRSHPAPVTRLALQYQPYFMIPLIALENAQGVEQERLHTLAQLYLEIMDGRVARYPVHLQLYGYNDFIRARFDRFLRRLGPLAGPLRRSLLGRLLAVQGYLDSAESGGIPVNIHRGPDGSFRRMVLRAPDPDRLLSRKIKRVVSLLAWHCRMTGVLPIRPMLRIGLPGEGNHIGGIFPMRKNPLEFETDLTGQMHGLPNVHLVDASILPRLPAASYTYTIMANAHRIGSMAAA
jgi:choline dehydrogenase-like flavoprotein